MSAQPSERLEAHAERGDLTSSPVKTRKKLIEVALPLDAINKASAREKSIRHGHPSTLHLWWARRPLAAARAVIFAQMVDDPSAVPEEFGSEAAQAAERQRLFRILENLVLWENTTNEAVLEPARAEIRRSWRRACKDNRDHPQAGDLFNPDKLPAFHDPFAGGGTLPLEAQRLGLEAHASDLNPVAVLINKAMIEIPPKFSGHPPVNPDSRRRAETDGGLEIEHPWHGAHGLAEDVRYYGKWMRDEAKRKIGHLYPPVHLPDGTKATAVAWLWARTVASPNPAAGGAHVPLVTTFVLSSKQGKEAIVIPVVEGNSYRFTVKSKGIGKEELARAKAGTKRGRGANFTCLVSGAPILGDYIKTEGMAGRMSARLIAVVAQGDRSRVYVEPTTDMEQVAQSAKPAWRPEGDVPRKLTGGTCYGYGLTNFADLFTDRQLKALETLCDLVGQARERVIADAHTAGFAEEDSEVEVYADAVATYLGLCVSRQANRSSNLSFWHTSRATVEQVFARQALPMVWDYCEGNPFSDSSGNFVGQVRYLSNVVQSSPPTAPRGSAAQADAAYGSLATTPCVMASDPPYYDNIGYADLSDFFYVWLKRALGQVHPELFRTLLTPKSTELIAAPHRFDGDKAAASYFFEGRLGLALAHMRNSQWPGYPMTLFYAYKQAETKRTGVSSRSATASTGWETMLAGIIDAGFAIGGTWPVRTELVGNLKKQVAALASSIVVVCRKRPDGAPFATRREFIAALRAELPSAFAQLQNGNIAPVDLAQAAIGPGMAVYTRYTRVIDAQGNPVTVRDALAFINQILDETLAKQEGDFDADTRWALGWFEQHGFAEGNFGVAETLSTAKNTSVQGLERAGILKSKFGKVSLLPPHALPEDWNPATDTRLTVWEVVHHLVRALETGGDTAAAALVAQLGGIADTARELTYRLYTVAERQNRAAEAFSYNALVQSWPEIARLAQANKPPAQTKLL